MKWVNDVICDLVERFWTTGQVSGLDVEPSQEQTDLWKKWALEHAVSYVGPILGLVENLFVHSYRRSGGRLQVRPTKKVKLMFDAAMQMEQAAESLDAIHDSESAAERALGAGKKAIVDLDLHGGCVYQLLRWGRCLPPFPYELLNPAERDVKRCAICGDNPEIPHKGLSRKEACFQLDTLLKTLEVWRENKKTGKRPSRGEKGGAAAVGIVYRFTKKYVKGAAFR